MTEQDVINLLRTLTADDVTRGMAYILATGCYDPYHLPQDWEHVWEGHFFGACMMIAYAAHRSDLRTPLGSMPFTGNTDRHCRQRLEELGFGFTKVPD